MIPHEFFTEKNDVIGWEMLIARLRGAESNHQSVITELENRAWDKVRSYSLSTAPTLSDVYMSDLLDTCASEIKTALGEGSVTITTIKDREASALLVNGNPIKNYRDLKDLGITVKKAVTHISMSDELKKRLSDDIGTQIDATGFGGRMDNVLSDIPDGERKNFVNKAFNMAYFLADNYITGQWQVAELNNKKGFFIYRNDGADIATNFSLIMRDENGQHNGLVTVDSATFGVIVTLTTLSSIINNNQDDKALSDKLYAKWLALSNTVLESISALEDEGHLSDEDILLNNELRNLIARNT